MSRRPRARPVGLRLVAEARLAEHLNLHFRWCGSLRLWGESGALPPPIHAFVLRRGGWVAAHHLRPARGEGDRSVAGDDDVESGRRRM